MINSSDTGTIDYSFTIKNSGSATLTIGVEMWGFYWPLEPGDEFEFVFDDARNFWSVEAIDFSENDITYWGIYPSMVYPLTQDGKKEAMMNR